MTPAGSPLASQPGSPISMHRGDPLELTPRSKVKAMVAAIDADSDSDLSPHLEGHRPLTKDPSTSVPSQARESESHDSHELSSEDLSHRPSAPRGKLAARLQQQGAASPEERRCEDNGNGDPYSRMKRKLQSHPAERSTEESHNGPHPVSETDDDVVLAITTRRERKLFPAGSERAQSPGRDSRRTSPGLFVTSEKEQEANPAAHSSSTHRSPSEGSDSDLPADPQANSRFLALVARKREEREAKAKAEEEKKAKRRARFSREEVGVWDNHVDMMRRSSDESDVADASKLTQHARPTRKASKKALEEMSRETQRMSRNMQLAHQARTKKKITKESLFARFNFRTGSSAGQSSVPTNSSSAAASSNPTSDAEARRPVETPPTSPVSPGDEIPKPPQSNQEPTSLIGDNLEGQLAFLEVELPDTEEIITQSQQRLAKGNSRRAGHFDVNEMPVIQETRAEAKGIAKKPIHVRVPKLTTETDAGTASESDLEILPAKKKAHKLDVFDRLPASKATEGRSLQTLRALAHLTSPNKHVGRKASMTLTDMQDSLQKRARQQAARERAEKIQQLKDRGVIIQTAEEREKDQAEVEDLLEKARKEAAELKQEEKNASKKQAKANGQEGISDDTSDEDEDYEENDADESDIELSGSDDEGGINDARADESGEVDGDGQEDRGEGSSLRNGGLIEEEASETTDESENDASDTDGERPRQIPVRRGKHKVIDDEEDDEAQGQEPEVSRSTQVPSQQPVNSVLPIFGGAPMGLTQAFAATMADTQTQSTDQDALGDQEQDSLAFLGAPPEPGFPLYEMYGSPQMIADSQEVDATKSQSQAKITLDFSQSQIQETSAEPPATQTSEIPDPTQDIGFALSSPAPGRFASVPPSTVDTVILPQVDEPESPRIKRKGRLRRKTDFATNHESSMPSDASREQNDMDISANAFEVLKKGLKRPHAAPEKFDKKKSNAHEMVEEQAQESEDEYAGLGGASEDESGGEEDEEVRKMIDQGEVDVDERQLAAFYADKERASDEKAVEKLFKDINNGMLRRKRGADFDLSDSDDDVEARQRRKRREFAKMRKALLENENVGKIAEDPKKMAFLRAIEDRDDDDGLDFLEELEESQPTMVVDSQETPESQQPENPVTALGKRKRPLAEANSDVTNRAPATTRRRVATKKPASLADIRASVSFLIEAPDAMPIAPPSSSPIASDNENENDENTNADLPLPNSRNSNNRFSSRRNPNPVIDRLTLKRTSSSSTSTSNASRLAFHEPSANPVFKVPSLLRRATTTSFNNSQDSNGISTLAETERSAGGGEKGDFVRRGGTKRSSVNWIAREKNRVEGRVGEEVRRRIVRQESSLTGLGGGAWE
ncbi:MAG: hypothetical protein Q9181_004098 [Wetmoreana brouardii]